MNVLVVEDSAVARHMLRAVLMQRGHAVTALRDAETAWELVQHTSFPLILLDWILPGMDGIELCRRIRRLPEGDQSVILVISERERPEDLDAVLDAGASDYFPKSADNRWLGMRLTVAERQAADIVRRIAAEAAKRESERRVAHAFTDAAIGISLSSPEGRHLQVNPALCALFGYTEQELLATTVDAIMHPDERAAARARRDRALAGEIGHSQVEKRYVHKDGHVVWVHLSSSLVYDEHQRPLYFVNQLQDITASKRAEAALQESEHSFRMLIEKSPVGTCIVDELGIFEIVNPAFASICGYSADEILGRHLSLIVPEVTRTELAEGDRERVAGRDEATYEREVLNKQGQPMTVLSTALTITGSDGRPRRAVFIVDISEQKRIEHYLAHVAHHDALTGLPNRILFHDRLTQAMLSAKRQYTELALLLVDLDRFKEVNDTLGHATGDRLLQEVASRMRGAVRASDTVARLGGDEFALLLPQTDRAGAIRVADKILTTLAMPISLDGHAVEVGSSIGIVLYPQHGEDAGTLLGHADQAMYAAKASGGGYVAHGAEPEQPGEVPVMLNGISFRSAS